MTRIGFRTLVVGLVAVIAVGASVSPAATVTITQCTRWVATSGDDSWPGTEAQPWRTLQHAADSASAGDVVCVAAGTYAEDDEVRFGVSGEDGAPITFTTAGAAVTVQGGMVVDQDVSHLRLNGFEIAGFSVWGVSLHGGNSDVVLSNLRISGGEAGIHFTVGNSGDPPQYGPVDHVTVEDTVVEDCVYSAVDCTPGPCDHMTFRRVEVSGAGVAVGFAGDALAVERGSYIQVEDCYFHDNGGDGIDLNSRDVGQDMPGIVVNRCRVERSGRNGVKLWGGGRLTNTLVSDCGDSLLVLEWGTFDIVNNTFASMDVYNYMAVLGNYDEVYPATVNLHNNIFSNDDENMGGTLLYYPRLTTLLADHNLYYNPYRDSDVICATFLPGEPCFSADEINSGAWTAASGQGAHSRYADPLYFAPGADDHHLTAASPAVDAGSASHAPADDLEGLPRDAAPDIGAYEYREPTSCVIACSATVPATAGVGEAVPFQATVNAAGCSGQPAVDWDFGDGSSGSGVSTTHAYAASGAYGWVLTAAVDDQRCERSGSIAVGSVNYPFRYLVPAVSHGPGAAGTQWRTSVAALNPGGLEAQVELTLFASGGSTTRATTLAGGSTTEWVDIVVSLFEADPMASTAGAVEVAADRRLLLTSRTYNQAATGTYGQYLPALTASEGLTSGLTGRLLQIKRNADFRTNIGFANPGSQECQVRLRLFDAGGTQVGTTRTITVPARGWVQENDVFSSLGAGNMELGSAAVEVLTSGGAVWAYASVVDNHTGDATTIPVLEE